MKGQHSSFVILTHKMLIDELSLRSSAHSTIVSKKTMMLKAEIMALEDVEFITTAVYIGLKMEGENHLLFYVDMWFACLVPLRNVGLRRFLAL